MAPAADISSMVLTLTITIDGSALPSEIQVMAIEVNYQVNRIPSAQITIVENANLEMDTFVVDEAMFDPGKVIEISLGYDNNNTVVFKGLILKNSFRVSDLGSTITLDCRDKLVKMTSSKHNKVFLDKKDSDVISSLVSDAGLSATVTATTTVNKQLFQYHCTDWDFMLNRAEANGLYLFPSATAVKVAKPEYGTEPITLTYGIDVLSADLSLDAQNQYGSVEAHAWDVKTQAMLTGTSSEPSINAQSSIAASTLKAVLNEQVYNQYSASFVTQAELEDWASARLTRARLSRIKGRLVSYGNGTIAVGNVVTLAKISSKFNGKGYISGLSHRVENGTWETTLQLGLDDLPYYEEQNLTDLPAGGQLPAVNGLLIGMVKKIDADPEDLSRVQVSVMVEGGASLDVWARLSSYYASSGFGAYFYPEVNDEVILGFVSSDPRDAIILGSLHGKNKPPYTPAAENFIKGWVTKEKLKVTFDDEKKIMTLETPGGNKVTLDDDAKSIKLEDMNGNTTTLDDSGIKLDTKKDVMIKATGKITLDGAGGVIVKSSGGDVKMSGLNIEAAAQIGATVKGNATAEVSASGQTTIKGAIVMIN